MSAPNPCDGIRRAQYRRSTQETLVRCQLALEGSGRAQIQTGLPFLDHMLGALARFARLDLELEAAGDFVVDDHHTVEDTALALGSALDQALGDRAGVQRFAHAYAPLDEALVRAVVDLSGRPFARIDLRFARPTLGTVATENLTHFLRSLSLTGRFTLHVDELCGENDHHRAEAAFKALGLALGQAIARRTGDAAVPSTKGVLG